MNDRLYQLVSEAMQNAKENGYTFDDWLVEEIAEDMIEYDADISSYDLNDVVDCIIEYSRVK